jgi:hypothetical protein
MKLYRQSKQVPNLDIGSLAPMLGISGATSACGTS